MYPHQKNTYVIINTAVVFKKIARYSEEKYIV